MIDRKLVVFRMAAALGNFTEAAAALGMSQPNVTQQMTRLEETLGVRLFERDGRNVSLTPAGRELASGCEQLFSDSAKLIRSVRCASAGVKHRRVGGTLTAGGYVLPDLIAAYMRERSGVSLSLTVANMRGVADALAARRLDVALVEGPFEQNCFLPHLFLEEDLVPAFAPGTQEEVFSLAEYVRAGKLLVLRESGSGTRWHFDRFLEKAGIPTPNPRAVLEVNSFDALKLFVRSGLGVTVISPFAIRDEVAAGTLSMGRFSEGPIRRELNFIRTPDADHKFADDFISFCIAEYSATRKAHERR